jgi:hypothetical protein
MVGAHALNVVRMMAKKSTENIEQQRGQGGRFLTGNNGGPGRPKGSHDKVRHLRDQRKRRIAR